MQLHNGSNLVPKSDFIDCFFVMDTSNLPDKARGPGSIKMFGWWNHATPTKLIFCMVNLLVERID